MNSNDIQIIWDNDTGNGDIAFVNGDFKRGKPIETATILSMFCDARSDRDSVEWPSRRGWWGDLVRKFTHTTGSSIWQLERTKINKNTMNLLKAYCESALKWLVTDGVAGAVSVKVSEDTSKSDSEIRVNASILKDGIILARLEYNDFWNAQIEDGE